MEGKELIAKANEAFEKSNKELLSLQKEIARQDAEFAEIKRELQQLGLNPDTMDIIPESILSLSFPKELSDVANSFKQIMEELNATRNITTSNQDKGKKVFNPMNKLKML